MSEQQENKPIPKDSGLAKSELVDEDKARMELYEKRKKAKPLKFKKKVLDDGRNKLDVVNPKDNLALVKFSEAFGSADPDLAQHLLTQVVSSFAGVSSFNGISPDGLDYDKVVPAANVVMAIFAGIKPQNEIEAMLAVQMVSVHNLASECIKQAISDGQSPEGRQANVRYATKMTRTFIAQMAALKNYRQGGQQKMTVEHVHVNEGGQAIVGQVNQGGKPNAK